MQRPLSIRHLGLGLAALLITAAAYPATAAVFSANAPGEDLVPIDGAEFIIDLVQGQQHLLWSTISGSVATIEVIGWPTSDGTHDLGGALVIEQPDDGLAGVIDFGEKPMEARFNLSG